MMRGVYCPLETCIAIRSEPNVKTMNERLKVITALNSAFAPSMPNPRKFNCSRVSSACNNLPRICWSTTATIGMIQSDDRI
jgi:hypothetical protein